MEQEKEEKKEKAVEEKDTGNEDEKDQEEEEEAKDIEENEVEPEEKDEEEGGTELSTEEDMGSYEDVLKVYSDDRYPTDIFLTLKEFRDSSLLTDLTLSTDDGKDFNVHSLVLAAVSAHVQEALIERNWKRNWSMFVGPEVDHVGLQAVLEFAYTGAILALNRETLITGTSLQLQYEPALSLCLNFLQQEINPDSCLDVVSFAEAYGMVHLLEMAEDFVLRQFQKVSCTSKFKDLRAEHLLKYLNSKSLCVPSELVVFKAVVAWIQAKPTTRMMLAKELMKTIHFPLMTFKEFKEVQSLNMWSDRSLSKLFAKIFEDFCSNDTDPQNQCRVYLPKESLVLVGGEQISGDFSCRRISKELWFGNSLRNHTGIMKAMEWRQLGEMPEPPRLSHEVAVLKGLLYVIGGRKYDPLQNSWERLADMREKRCSFSVVVLNGKLYAIGGDSQLNNVESVECYCPTANSWSFTRPLDMPLTGHAGCVLHEQIFVSGGLSSGYQCQSSMFSYHPEKGNTYLANMNKPRAHHCMESLGGHLYVAGGVTTDENMAMVDHLACEVYNPVADCWTAIMRLTAPHVGAGSAVLEGKFYVLGGYSQEDYSDTKLTHRYDPNLQQWENMGKMPGPNNDIRASVLFLPPHLRS
uniref:Kelch-like family member 33 n=1 Tax=Myripristis murdjan TaxID=586833 RepID=A0A667WN03_9TELE